MMSRGTPALFGLVLSLVAVREADAQSASRAVVGAGASVMEFDLDFDQASRGTVLRGGMAPSWLFDVELVGQYWPDLGFYRGASLLGELSVYPVGRSRVSPFIAFGAGYFSAWDRLGVGVATARGLSKTFGVGVRAQVWRSWGVRLDASVRFDPNALDDELRVALVSSPALTRPGDLPGGSAHVAVFSLTPATGPWHAVDPGLGFSFATPVSARQDAVLNVLLLHWQTEGSTSFSGWDTRAVAILPSWAWVWGRNGTSAHLGVGPAATLMFEGPDDGLRGGFQVDAGVTAALGGGFTMTGGAALVWLIRSERTDYNVVARLPGDDERALMLRLGIGR